MKSCELKIFYQIYTSYQRVLFLFLIFSYMNKKNIQPLDYVTYSPRVSMQLKSLPQAIFFEWITYWIYTNIQENRNFFE
nr:MAG TPA: hypothetical protein [Bacteriophage sp.]